MQMKVVGQMEDMSGQESDRGSLRERKDHDWDSFKLMQRNYLF